MRDEKMSVSGVLIIKRHSKYNQIAFGILSKYIYNYINIYFIERGGKVDHVDHINHYVDQNGHSDCVDYERHAERPTPINN